MAKASKKENEKIDKIISKLEEAITRDKRDIEILVVHPYKRLEGLYANINWQGGKCNGLETALGVVKEIKNGAL